MDPIGGALYRFQPLNPMVKQWGGDSDMGSGQAKQLKISKKPNNYGDEMILISLF